MSGLNTLPASSPVNASCLPLPINPHDSGPAWLARPSLPGTFTLQHIAGFSRRTRTLRLSRARKRERSRVGMRARSFWPFSPAPLR